MNDPNANGQEIHFLTFQACSPKELLIGLLEQLEQDDPVTIAESLCLLLSPLQKGKDHASKKKKKLKKNSINFTSLASHFSVLMSLGSRKASSLGMTLSSVLDQVAKLPVPETKEQEEDDVFMICRCCIDLVNFVRPFVDEARQNTRKSRVRNDTQTSGDLHSTEDELRTELLKL